MDQEYRFIEELSEKALEQWDEKKLPPKYGFFMSGYKLDSEFCGSSKRVLRIWYDNYDSGVVVTIANGEVPVWDTAEMVFKI